jgi:1-acyl-sn-glycerol-3-phosphate acyltransferase
MLKGIASIVLRLFGWEVTGGLPQEVKKCIIIIAPHTSQWDFIIGRLAFWHLGLKVRFLIKKEFFFFPVGPVLRWLGGLPVNRSKGASSVNQILDIFDSYDTMSIIITPEGTRKYSANWKRGFYFISQKANIPIALAYLNYQKKRGGIGPLLLPSGDFEKDFKYIEDYYRDIAGPRHPERFNL